jgi:signal transduction histidine kinase
MLEVWDIYLKKVEKESFLKSFILFFLSQTLLASALFYLNYEKEVQTLDTNLFSKMRVCSYTLTCKEFQFDFVAKKSFEAYKLYKTPQALSAYFPILGSDKNYLKLFLPAQSYKKQLTQLKNQEFIRFLVVMMLLLVLSMAFSFYTLSPLRNALHLTEEFIKDILHDFNTPLATLRLNIAMLKNKEDKKIIRMQNAIQNILDLQSNLKAYLQNHQLQKELFVLEPLVQERIALLEKNFPEVTFTCKLGNRKLHTNKDAFIRIVDNLLSNAGKYNKRYGHVDVFWEDKRFIISDTGKGIEKPSMVFERFYKEQERGIGIGLHIVKKLCDELGIKIYVESELGVGSRFILTII